MSMMVMPFTYAMRYAELTYEQKRAIREKLTESFDGHDGRYLDSDVSDHSIAQEVGVGWSLIRYVRERDFGTLAT